MNADLAIRAVDVTKSYGRLGASIPGDAWVRSMVQRNMPNVELKEALFVFPSWLVLAVVLFALLTTTLAAVYPARRAANIDPVAALRHE